MIVLHLVRHGEVDNPNHVVYADLPGFDLSPDGVLQAHHLGRHLAATHLDAVMSSPLERAVHTANLIASGNDVAVGTDERLTETSMYPSWTGKRWEEVDVDHPAQLAGYLADATALSDVQETVLSMATRLRSVVQDAIDSGFRRFAIVGHQDPIASGRLLLLGAPLSHLRIDPPLHGSCTELRSVDGNMWSQSDSWAPGDAQVR